MTDSIQAPLQGIRVVDFCAIYAGPYACSTLGTLGAEVIRVETRIRPDGLRTGRIGRPPDAPADAPGFHTLNHNKKGITINLRDPRGAELVKRLVPISDVVVENYRPGVMENLGIDYEQLRPLNPELIMLSLSAMGDSGPERRYGALATTFSALGGLSHLTGYADGAPTEFRGSADLRSGLVGAFAVLAALYHRQRTGQGQRIDMAAREAMSCVIGDTLLDYSMNGRVRNRDGNRDRTMAPHNVYRCSGDDHWVSIAVATDDEWRSLCTAIGQPSLADDPRFCDAHDRWDHQAELDEIITAWTSEQTDYAAMNALQSAGVAAMLSLRSDQVPGDPHLTARGFLHPVQHERVGKITLLSSPWRMSGSPGFPPAAGPMLGEHNDYVFGELLQMGAEEIDALVDAQVIY